MSPDPRYDDIADWYVAWVGDSEGVIVESDLLPPDISDARVLDVACGHGRAARALARRGANVVGVDLSAELIGRARAESDGITYHAAAISDLDGWWDGQPFDGAVCEMALMDIDDLDGALSTVARVLRGDGWFAVSIVHPLLPRGDVGLSSWPVGKSYFDEGFWTSAEHDPDGVRIRVGSLHRTVSTYLNGLIGAGFRITRVIEPPGPGPMLMLIGCRRLSD